METLLPKGYQPTEDEVIIDHLVRDTLFRESLEAEFGKIVRIYPDWHNDHLVYEFLNGSCKYSTLSEIIKTMKDIGYLKDSMH